MRLGLFIQVTILVRVNALPWWCVRFLLYVGDVASIVDGIIPVLSALAITTTVATLIKK